MKTVCIYTSKSHFDDIASQFKSEDIILFPEFGLTFEEIRNIPRIENKVVVTTHPTVCTNYKVGELYTVVNGELNKVYENLYGAVFDIACKKLDYSTKCSLSNHIIEEIRANIAVSDEAGLEFLETLSDSPERAYLKVKLSNGK